jgi:RNA polymerase sigma-70 factor (ECF subfamily)
VATYDWDLSVSPDQETLGDRRLAAAVLERFDPTTQAVAVAVLVDGMPHDEVARALDVSRKTVGRKLARFLDRARKHLVRSAT